MSEEQLKALIEKAKNDTELLEQLKTADSTETVIGMAKEAGFSITADDLKPLEELELSDEELEGVSGGFSIIDCKIAVAVTVGLASGKTIDELKG